MTFIERALWGLQEERGEKTAGGGGRFTMRRERHDKHNPMKTSSLAEVSETGVSKGVSFGGRQLGEVEVGTDEVSLKSFYNDDSENGLIGGTACLGGDTIDTIPADYTQVQAFEEDGAGGGTYADFREDQDIDPHQQIQHQPPVGGRTSGGGGGFFKGSSTEAAEEEVLEKKVKQNTRRFMKKYCQVYSFFQHTRSSSSPTKATWLLMMTPL